MKRYLRLVRIFIGATIAAQLEYRANFIGALLASLGEVGVALLGLYVLLSQPETTTLGGWNWRQALLVTGFFTLTEGFISVFIQPNLSKLSENIRTGNMDFTLLKPLDAQFSISTRSINMLRLGDLLLGLGTVVYAAWNLPVTLGGVALALGLYLCALVMVYAIWLMLSTTAFWFVKTQNAPELFNGVFGAARFPAAAFPAPVRFVLTYIIPVTLMTTLPAQALSQRLASGLLWCSPLLALVLFGLSRLLWLRAVASYTSASS